MAGKQKYTPEEIAEVMEIMRKNNGSVAATHRITKISRATLTRWKATYYQGIAIRAKDRVAKKITESFENVHTAALIKEGELEAKANQVKNAILDRIKELVPYEKNMDRLSNALKTMHTISTGDDPDDPKRGNTLNIYQEVQQLILQQNGNSKDRD